MKVWVPQLIDDIKKQESLPTTCIQESGLLKNQKTLLVEVAEHNEISNGMRSSMAKHLIDERKARYDWIVKLSDLMIRIAPIFGCLGTLIQIGSIIVLGEEGHYVLSEPLLPAFGTVIFGLISAAICMVISMIRKRWYANDISVLETLMECVLEVTNTGESEQLQQNVPHVLDDQKEQRQETASSGFASMREISETEKVSNTEKHLQTEQAEQPVRLSVQSFMPPGQIQERESAPEPEQSEPELEQPTSELKQPASEPNQPLRVYLPAEGSDPDQPMRVFLSEDQTIARPEPEQPVSTSMQMSAASQEVKSVPPVQTEPSVPQQDRQAVIPQKILPVGFSFMPKEEQQRILREMGVE